MSKNHTFLSSLLVLSLLCFDSSSAQTGNDLYKLIKDQPSKMRWCLPEAGDDPGHIISRTCKVYEGCFSDLNLGEKVYRQALPGPPS